MKLKFLVLAVSIFVSCNAYSAKLNLSESEMDSIGSKMIIAQVISLGDYCSKNTNEHIDFSIISTRFTGYSKQLYQPIESQDVDSMIRQMMSSNEKLMFEPIKQKGQLVDFCKASFAKWEGMTFEHYKQFTKGFGAKFNEYKTKVAHKAKKQ